MVRTPERSRRCSSQPSDASAASPHDARAKRHYLVRCWFVRLRHLSRLLVSSPLMRLSLAHCVAPRPSMSRMARVHLAVLSTAALRHGGRSDPASGRRDSGAARRADRHRRRDPPLRGAGVRATPAGRGEPGRLPHGHPGASQRPALRGALPVRARQPAERDPAPEPRRPEVRGLEGHRRQDPRGHPGGGGRGRAHRRGAGLLRGFRRHDARAALLGQGPTTRGSSRTRPPTTS